MRKFLVVLDESPESQNAIRFAAMRASRTSGGVVVLAIIGPDAIQHGIGVADLMRQEAEDRITSQYQIFARWMRESQGVEPELVIREGDPTTELLAQLNSDREIGVLILGAGSGKDGPGPILSRLLRDLSGLPCPITLVPGDISRERLEAIS
ncbi:Nucleotide-binding universal stress protein, UspA family [Paracoccus isoporae]|uniref:Nucleotide-binding universal stress protein, UspA family n=1 Tax=Paracoccus isoporae TaxID=591205 RepID=A0A1G7CLL1_9RHOB|nr:universal stress protein [Paracoccus isoporae]SDE39345.1 Nucleotide-binding universal stress protein, UspA family [Paracoccus isoporae]